MSRVEGRRAGADVFRGSLVALPTPFARGRIDFPALLGLIERQVAARTDGIVVAGSTGEGGALSRRERLALFEFASGVADGRIGVVAGVGAGSTAEAVDLARAAELARVDGILATTPAYCRPNPTGLERHFAAVAAATGLPVCLYNIPVRTGVDLGPEVVARLVTTPNVVAIKEASGSLERLRALLAIDGLAVLTGDDRLIVDALELGAAGVIGVVGNLVPNGVRALLDARSANGGPDPAPAVLESLMPLVVALECDTNPVPLKAAMAALGWIREELRLPLLELEPSARERVAEALRNAGLAPDA